MIEKYIKSHIISKFGSRQSLVVYDKTKFYKSLLLDMQDDKLAVFDISNNAIIQREEALEYWTNDLVDDREKKMIVYVPFAKDKDKDLIARDPFVFFGEGHNFFPDEAMDDYKQLCLAALPSKVTQIEEIFSKELFPSFALIDTLEKGNKFPMLKSLTQSESDAELLQSILLPSDAVGQELSKDNSWVSELKQWAKLILQYRLAKRSLKGIQEELWQGLLYSEFLYDLPNEVLVPDALSQVKVFSQSCKALVFKVAETIRKNIDSNDTYVAEANKVSEALQLASYFAKVTDLGKINTFSFEDNTYFNQFIDSILEQKIDEPSTLLKNSNNSIWTRYDDDTGKRWMLGKYSLDIIKFIKKEGGLDFKTLSFDKLIELYATKWYEIDKLNREFEKLISEIITIDAAEKKLIAFVRENYRIAIERLQDAFQSKFVSDYNGSQVLKNIDLFDKKVSPFVSLGRKTAYILVDALRFELAKTFVERLTRAKFEVDIEPSLAFIPSITKYGMAALLPSAAKKMELKQKSGKLLPFFDDKQIDTRELRKKYTEDIYGDKVIWYWMNDVFSTDIDLTKDIYFITSTEIDGAGENLPDNALLLIEESLKKLLKLCIHLTNSGIEELVIVADHGFVLNESFINGNKADKPTGDWSLSTIRCLAGKGDRSDATITLTPDELGVKANVDAFHFLKQFATFRSGAKYFHEGISLQELVTPYISLRKSKAKDTNPIEVYLSYRGKSEGSITSRRPAISIDSSIEGMLFAEPIDMAIEVISGETVVGKLVSSASIDSTTEFLEITPGQNDKIRIAMDDEFEGEFTVVAKDPSTGMILSTLKLKTDYL